jgi:hypothetical protein
VTVEAACPPAPACPGGAGAVGVGGICHANFPSASALAARTESSADAETAIWRTKLMASAKATVQTLTVANPNTNNISCSRRVIFSLLHHDSLYVYFTINWRFFKYQSWPIFPQPLHFVD